MSKAPTRPARYTYHGIHPDTFPDILLLSSVNASPITEDAVVLSVTNCWPIVSRTAFSSQLFMDELSTRSIVEEVLTARSPEMDFGEQAVKARKTHK